MTSGRYYCLFLFNNPFDIVVDKTCLLNDENLMQFMVVGAYFARLGRSMTPTSTASATTIRASICRNCASLALVSKPFTECRPFVIGCVSSIIFTFPPHYLETRGSLSRLTKLMITNLILRQAGYEGRGSAIGTALPTRR